MADNEILDYELIIVDDASTDHTGKLADEMAAADPHVRVVHHPVNRKLGGSMKTGFATATGDLVLYSDADLPFDMAEVSRAIRFMRYYDADIVSAFRFDRTEEGSVRTVYTFFYNFLIRRLFGVRMRDINFAFKLCRTSIFDHISLSSEGSFIDAELIIRAKKLGFHVIQFGVDYFPRTRGESTLGVGQRHPQDRHRDGATAARAARSATAGCDSQPLTREWYFRRSRDGQPLGWPVPALVTGVGAGGRADRLAR